MRIIGRETIDEQLSKDAILEAVRNVFIAHERGEIQSPSPMHMTFHNDDGKLTGDCHVKAAHSSQHPVIAIKVALGFYDNPARGLPVNDGLVMLLSRETGEPKALLQDEGLLTTYRTAAAGAIAAGLVDTSADDVIGIVGTGTQAFEQAVWSAYYLGLENVMVFGRSPEKTQALVARLQSRGFSASAADNVRQLCSSCRIVITTTPATEAVVAASDVTRSDIHFVAVGADTYGKQELDTEILRRAKMIIVDDKEQCLDHGEVAAARAAGHVDARRLTGLGSVLADELSITGGLTIVDLTGLGAQDLAIASLIQ